MLYVLILAGVHNNIISHSYDNNVLLPIHSTSLGSGSHSPFPIHVEDSGPISARTVKHDRSAY